jgi:hypothetical protein
VLRYIERTRTSLDEDAPEAGWLDVKRFLFDPDLTDIFTLHSLLRHPYWRDDYLVPNSPLNPHGTRHGPYLLDCLGTDSFELYDGLSAEVTLHQWVDESGLFDPGSYPPVIHSAERMLASATTIYHLKDLRTTCEHDAGGHLGEFHEFILLNAHDGVFTVLVASSTELGTRI